MRIDTLVVLIGSLAGAAAGSGTARAQAARHPAAPMSAAVRGPGAELAMSGALMLVVPTVGASISVPVGRGFAAEGGASVLLLGDEGQRRVGSHLQVRIPRRHKPAGAWESIAVGVATFPELDDFLAGGETRTRVRPQVAATWHWLRPRGNGVRLDVGILSDFRAPVPWPFVKVAAVVPLRSHGAREVRLR